MPHIFELFVQGPPLTGSMSSGLGIGLALVKQLVELHGGKVHAESQGGGAGATLIVNLPKMARPELRADAPGVPEHGGRSVLLVEDDADAMAATAEVLRLMNHRVVEAKNREEVLRVIATEPVDVIVMDIGMPGQDGYEIAKELRRLPATRSLPMIALTGFGQEADRSRAMTAGFNEHLVKPVDPDRLARVIDVLTPRDELAGVRS